jgi:translation elongation factor EF-Tu-like GTPase
VKVSLYLLSSDENGRKTAIRPGFTDRVFCSTWDQSGRVLFDTDMLMPGEHTDAYLVFVKEVPVRPNIAFAIRENRKRTIARGVVTNVYKPVSVEDSFAKFDFSKIKPGLKEI